MFYRCSHVNLGKCVLVKALLKKHSGRFNPIPYGGQVQSHNFRNFFL